MWTIAGVLKRVISIKLGITNQMTEFFILLLPCVAITFVLCIFLKKVIDIEKDILKI